MVYSRSPMPFFCAVFSVVYLKELMHKVKSIEMSTLFYNHDLVIQL